MFPIGFSHSTCQLLFYKNIESFKDDKKIVRFHLLWHGHCVLRKEGLFHQTCIPPTLPTVSAKGGSPWEKASKRCPSVRGFLSAWCSVRPGFCRCCTAHRSPPTRRKRSNTNKPSPSTRRNVWGATIRWPIPKSRGAPGTNWFLVVNVMHGYGMDLTDQETQAITDLLYDLRKGLEKEAG